MAGSATTVRCRRGKDATKSGRSGRKTWSPDCASPNVGFASASALSRGAPNGSGEHRFRSGRSRSRASLSLSDSDKMSAEPEILNRTARIALALNDNGRVQAPSGKHWNGSGVIENGIDLMRGSELNGQLAFIGMEPEPTVGICAICGRPLTQVGPKGECLRCLADLG